MSVANVRPGQPSSDFRTGFDRSSQRRRSMLAKVHVAKKQLHLSEDDYRQIILDESGKMSAGDCSEAQLEKLLARFARQGFRAVPKSGAKPGVAMHPVARKARALWISLYQLGVVRNSSEPALEAFARRQLGCERLVWAQQSHGHRLIEALKAMGERAGWRQRGPKGEQISPRELRIGLCDAILHRLKELQVVPLDWTVETAAFRLAGIELVRADETSMAEQFSRIAAALGHKLRENAPELHTAEDDAR